MNRDSQWRHAFARQIAPIYAANPHVAAVLLGGSTARGHADRYSDIELGVFWHRPPTDDERRAAVVRSGGHLLRLYPYDAAEGVWCDDLMLGRRARDQPLSGVLAEVVHYTTETMQRTLDAVLVEYNPDEMRHLLIAGVVDGLALHNAPLIDGWRERAARYPDALRVAVVERHALVDHFWRWEMWLDRGPNLMMLYHTYAQIQQSLLHVLLGLNRVYYFGFKWIKVVEERLPIAPPGLSRRFLEVYRFAPAQGASHLAALVEETYTLIEQHLPQVDVARLRAAFRYQRPLWDAPPEM